MLDRFIELFSEAGSFYRYPQDPNEYDKVVHALDIFTANMREALYKQYLSNEFHLIRPSNIGKISDFDLLYGSMPENLSATTEIMQANHNEKLKLIFSMGHLFEAWVGFTLRRLGYPMQHDIEVKDSFSPLKAHIDYTVFDDDGSELILEIKTASDYYFNSVLTHGISDERGYITQLVIYQRLTNLPAYWLFVNKTNAKMFLISLDDLVPKDIQDAKFARAQHIAHQAKDMKSLYDIYEMCKIPAPAIECNIKGEYITDDKGLPKLYIPHTAMFPHVYYQTVEGKTNHGKKREYIVDFKYPKGFPKKVPDIYEYTITQHQLAQVEASKLFMALQNWKLS